MLTQERRAELVALLGDSERLRAEHPRVAEYLEMAPRLSGTDNLEADAAFELRMVHYLTGGAAPGENPYWAIVEPSVSIRDGRRKVDGGSARGSARLAFAETILQGVYAYAVPSPETLAWCHNFCERRAVVELGAGRGYWAALLSRGGSTVYAYDSEPPDAANNVSFPQEAGYLPTWHSVKDSASYAVRGGAKAGEVLLLCWPPGWGDEMASRALGDFEKAGGRHLIYVGEPAGGRTGDDAFFTSLEARWRLHSQDESYVSWWNLSDTAQAWVLD